MATRPQRRSFGLVERTSSPAVLAGYVLLGLVLLHPDRNIQTHVIAGGPDAESFIWDLSWWPWAVSHGVDPLVSKLVWHPVGFPMLWATSVPTASLLSLPITLLAGAAASFNILSLSGPPLAAWSAYLLARQLKCRVPASLFCGFVFGFSPYEFGQLLGHLNLNQIFLVPLVALLAVRRVQDELPRRGFVAWMAVVLLLQFGLSSEVFATLCVFGATTWAVFAIAAHAELRRKLLQLAPELALAGLFAAVVIFPALLATARQARNLPAIPHSPQEYSSDLLNFVVPTFVTGPVRFAMALHFTGNATEQGAYLGIPLIVIVAWFALRSRHRLHLALVAATLLIAVASLGPQLWIGGELTNIRLPWAVATYLPLINAALPGRFSLYVALGSGLAAALWLSAGGLTRRQVIGRHAFAVVAVLFLVPDPREVAWSPLPLQPFFEPARFDAAVGRGTNVIIVPFADTGPGMLWQWQSEMHFTQTGGYLGAFPRQFAVPVVKALITGDPTPDFPADLLAFCHQNRVTRVLVGPGAQPALQAALVATDWPRDLIDAFTVFRVPAPSTAQ
ncbi:MAG TPA: hypothetical protein VJY39_06415 [Acidisphaera sp.]|nr:hypothetical protein [Acidisphaera sp.]